MESQPLAAGSPPGQRTLSCSCGKRLLIPVSLVGKKVKCPGCQRVLDVPAEDVTQALQQSLSPSDPSQNTVGVDKPKAEREFTDLLAPAQSADEIGRLGGYRVLKVLGAEDIPVSKLFTTSLGMEFVLVPKGKSWLGGGNDKQGDKEVEIPHDFYLGKYEVTQEEWQKVTVVLSMAPGYLHYPDYSA